MTLKITFAVWNLCNLHTSWNVARIYYGMFTHESESARGLSFRSLTEGLFKVTGMLSRALLIVPDRDVDATEH